MNSQEAAFLKSEGDKYFTRNRSILTDEQQLKDDIALRIIQENRIQPHSILDVGCVNGFRLAELQRRYRAKCTGIEPSDVAITDGKKRYPQITFLKGIASSLPILPGQQYDLVLVNYVLHWVSRDQLLAAISEIDRVVSDGGYLVIGDFLPDEPTRISYHHLPDHEVFTFKTNYPAIFLSSGIYSQVATIVYNHDDRTDTSEIPPQSRAACVLLKKNLVGLYSLRSRSP